MLHNILLTLVCLHLADCAEYYDITVRSLTNSGPNHGTMENLEADACEQLKNYAKIPWRNGTFTTCSLAKVVSERSLISDTKLTVRVRGKEVERDVFSPLNEAAAWKLNVLLNSGRKTCRSSVTIGRWDITYGNPVATGKVLLGLFVLVAEEANDVCTKILDQPMFDSKRLYIMRCNRFGRVIDGEPALSSYLLEGEIEVPEGENPDIHLWFLQELSSQLGSCRYNGFWFTLEYVQRITVGFMTENVEEPSRPEIQKHACNEVRKGARYYWENSEFTSCSLRTAARQFDKSYYMNLNAVVRNGFFNWISHGRSNLVAAWNLNVLLNSEWKSCRTVVTIGKAPAVSAQPPGRGGRFHGKYVLIGEESQELCLQITHKYKYVEGKLRVNGCRWGWEVIDAGYSVYELDTTIDVPAYQSPDIQLLFLKELSEDLGSCRYNGYWTELQLV